MKASMPSIIGNEKLRSRLCHDVLEHSVSHAYILSGPRGSGKHSLALQYAAAVACERKHDVSSPIPCLSCRSCRKIMEGKSPDVITVSKTGQSVKVDQIRELQSDVRKVPNDLDDKFYIIEDAHTLTPQAQNAFLLTLENPPAFVHFFLLCENEESLLETVRSRAPVLRTEPIPHADVKAYLLRTVPEALKLPQDTLDELLTIANGSVGRALELLDEKAREPFVNLRHSADELVTHALQKNTAALVSLTHEFIQRSEPLAPILSLAQTVLRDLIALKQSENASLCFYTNREAATELAYRYSLASLLRLCDIFAETEDHIERNANAKLTITAMIAKLYK